jgi:hypothetical protein
MFQTLIDPHLAHASGCIYLLCAYLCANQCHTHCKNGDHFIRTFWGYCLHLFAYVVCIHENKRLICCYLRSVVIRFIYYSQNTFKWMHNSYHVRKSFKTCFCINTMLPFVIGNFIIYSYNRQVDFIRKFVT